MKIQIEMGEVLHLLEFSFAVIFALAGTAKLLDPNGSRDAVVAFGVPKAAAGPAAVTLSLAELAIAVLFLIDSTAFLAAAAASAILAVFVFTTARQSYRGNTAECHCFGQVYSAPVSAATVARNVVLLLGALSIVVWRVARPTPARAAEAAWDLQPFAVTALIVGVIIAVSHLRRLLESNEKLSRQIAVLELISGADAPKVRQEAGDPSDSLPIGALIPEFSLADVSGAKHNLSSLLRGDQPVVLIFAGPNCDPCRSLIPDVLRWNNELKGKVRFALITSGSVEENLSKLGLGDAVTMLFDTDRKFAKSVHARWTPSALVVRRDGRIAARLVAGDSAIRELVEKLADADAADEFFHVRNGAGDRLMIGKTVPEFSLKAVAGGTITNHDLVGRKTLAVLWSRTCPHCVTMMEEIKRWDSTRRTDDPNLIIFSEGDAAEHAAFGLRSPILLESDYKTAKSLGMYGTPSAVLIDENAVIVTEAAIGASNIWSLIGEPVNGRVNDSVKPN